MVTLAFAQIQTDSYPLHGAIRSQDIDATRRLLSSGGRQLLAKQDSYGMLPMHTAVSTGNLEIVEFLLNKYGVDPNYRPNGGYSSLLRGRSPLHLAVTTGNLELVNILINAGSEFFLGDIGGVTPLHLAIQYGHLHIANRLIEAMGKRVHIGDKNGTTPLHLAARHGRAIIVARLLFLKAEQIPTHSEFKKHIDKIGDIQLLNGFLEKRFKTFADSQKNSNQTPFHQLIRLVNVQNDFGFSPLHYASAWGHTAVVKLLLQSGADINIVNNQNLTSLFLASRDGQDEVVELLTNIKDINLESGDEEAHTPLCVAVANGHLSIFARLLNSGANPHAKDKNGMIPLHIASNRGNSKAVVSLLQTNNGTANVNEQDNVGNTPLHYAAKSGKKEIIESLLQAGADISVLNIKSETATDIASKLGHEQLLPKLR